MLSLYGLLDKAIRKGRLTVVDAKGITREFGGTEPGPEAAIRFTSSTAPSEDPDQSRAQCGGSLSWMAIWSWIAAASMT
jgi:hypothetical protein